MFCLWLNGPASCRVGRPSIWLSWLISPPVYFQFIIRFQAHSFGVPPVIVDSTPHPHKHHGGLKTGYFPPSSRVMPRVSREWNFSCLDLFKFPSLHSSDIEAECRDDVMKLRVAFNDSFSGLVYSAGILASLSHVAFIKTPGGNVCLIWDE